MVHSSDRLRKPVAGINGLIGIYCLNILTIIRTTMLNLQRVTMFIAVVDAGSFTLAAAALGQTRRWSALTYGSWK